MDTTSSSIIKKSRSSSSNRAMLHHGIQTKDGIPNIKNYIYCPEIDHFVNKNDSTVKKMLEAEWIILDNPPIFTRRGLYRKQKDEKKHEIAELDENSSEASHKVLRTLEIVREIVIMACDDLRTYARICSSAQVFRDAVIAMTDAQLYCIISQYRQRSSRFRIASVLLRMPVRVQRILMERHALWTIQNGFQVVLANVKGDLEDKTSVTRDLIKELCPKIGVESKKCILDNLFMTLSEDIMCERCGQTIRLTAKRHNMEVERRHRQMSKIIQFKYHTNRLIALRFMTIIRELGYSLEGLKEYENIVIPIQYYDDKIPRVICAHLREHIEIIQSDKEHLSLSRTELVEDDE